MLLISDTPPTKRTILVHFVLYTACPSLLFPRHRRIRLNPLCLCFRCHLYMYARLSNSVSYPSHPAAAALEDPAS